jgi:hypothetical protein
MGEEKEMHAIFLCVGKGQERKYLENVAFE